MSKRIDKSSLRIIANDLNKCSDDLLQVYPYLTISEEGLRYGNKNNIKYTITQLRYDCYQLTGVLMEVLDD